MAAASSSSEIASEGPVLNLINKRLRALRKKLNRISQMEDSLSQGKILNKEQEETFRSKPSVLSAIDELEKLREPLAQAVGQEVQLALEKKEDTPIESKGEVKDEVSIASDLLNLIYFGSLFDVKTLMRAHDNLLLTRTHERNCCLSYDYVTDDDSSGEPLKEWDLDWISELGSQLISRPVTSSLSHKNALLNCVEHAKLWLANSEQPIEPNSSITYAGLKEKLNKIMASEYFTTTPEIKAPVEVAAAAGNFNFQLHESVISPASEDFQVESQAPEYPEEEEKAPGNETYVDETGPVEETHQEQEGEPEVEIIPVNKTQNEVEIPDTDIDQNSRDVDSKEQQYGNRRPYQNYRGGRGGGGNSRRGFANGRGGRGGNRGGYQTGRSQSFDQPGGNYGRNYNNYRGRGGRGMGGNYNYQASTGQPSHAQEAT